MTILKQRMSNEEALRALAKDNEDARTALYAVTSDPVGRDAKRKVLDLCDKHGVVGDAVARFFENTCGDNAELFRLVLVLEETGVRKYGIAKHVGSSSGRTKLKQAFQNDDLLKLAAQLVLHN